MSTREHRLLTTLRTETDQGWTAATEFLQPPTSSLARWVCSVAVRARGAEAVIVRGTSGSQEQYRDLLAAAAIRLIARRTRVVVSDATIEPGSRGFGAHGSRRRLVRVLSRLLIRLIDSPRVTWCVLSTAEVERFPRTWGIRHGQVVFTPFLHTLWRGESTRHVATGCHLFSGGNSLRDYDLLATATAGLDVPVVVASSSWQPDPVPSGVQLAAMSHEEFVRSMASSRAVVLCLQPAPRSTGQQTYLNAMALGRPTLVTDSDGVRDHIEDGITGVVMTPTVAGVRAAVSDVLNPDRAGHYARMGRRARDAVLRHHTGEEYRRRLVEVARGRTLSPVPPTPS